MSDVINYKSSGVDVEAGDALVDWIASQKKSGQVGNVVSGIGGFAALFRLDLKKYKKPVLISCTDGIGTKVKLASEFDSVFGTGIDLVAMCVNDLIVCGGDPLFFLDYFATGKLDLKQAQEFLSGVMEGLKQSNCVLIGGETAEMPGVYQNKDYDAAGFCVGIIDEDQVINGKSIKAGDIAVGVASSGFHSNGYSLLRKVLENDLHEWKEILMTPTRIYVELVTELKAKIPIKGMSHITGGGIIGNAPRVMPQDTVLKLRDWPVSDNFKEVQKRTGLTRHQMLETFNCGVGFVFFVDPAHQSDIVESCRTRGWSAFTIGVVEDGSGEARAVL